MDQEKYDELLEQQNKHWWSVGKKEIVLDYAEYHAGLKYNEGQKLLDVGCGMGVMLDGLIQYGEVYGIDMEERAVSHCNTLLYEYGFQETVVQGSLPDNIPFADNFFDYIFALDIIEHIEKDEEGIRKLNGLLKKNGKLIITVPAHMKLWSYNDELNHHFRRYEKEQLEQLLLRQGFKIIADSYYNSYLYYPIWLVRKMKKVMQSNTSDRSKWKDNATNKILTRIFTSEKRKLHSKGFKNGVSIIMACAKQ